MRKHSKFKKHHPIIHVINVFVNAKIDLWKVQCANEASNCEISWGWEDSEEDTIEIDYECWFLWSVTEMG